MTADDLEAGKDFGRYLDVDGDGIPYRTYPGTHPTQGRLLHPRHLARPLCALHRGRRAPTSTTCSGCCASSRPRRSWCRAPLQRDAEQADALRRDLLRLDRAGDGRGARHARGATGIHLDALRVRAFPFHDEVDDFIADHDSCSWSSRTATRSCARCWSTNATSIRRGSCRSCITTARRSPRASSPARSATISTRSKSRRCGKVGVMTYIAKPKFHHPDAAEERARLHAPRLRGLGLDAVRRLRPRLRSPPRSSRPASSFDRAAPRRQALRHRLLVEDADLLPRPVARLQLRARPHAVGADRRQPRQSRSDLSRRLRRRRLRLDRLRPVRACDPPRRQHGLYRREQRRVRPDQGPVLGDRRPRLEIEARRGQHRRRHRPRRHGAAARRDLRRALVLRRQDAARAADQGGDRAPGRRLHRRDLARASPSTITPARPRASTMCASTTRR